MQTKIHSQYYHPLTFNFVKAYLITMRPYLFFVSGMTGIVGLAYTLPKNLISTISIITASFLSYGFGQALTDCFQTDTDSISSPYRPLTQGIVLKDHFLFVSIAGLIFCITVFVIHNPINLILGTAAGLGLATYTYFKRKFWAGPFYNAWIVAVLCIMAFLTGENSDVKNININFLLVLISVFSGYANFVLSGYFKDIEADKVTGYNTLPVIYGRRFAAYSSDMFALVMVSTGFVIMYLRINEIGSVSSIIPAIAFLSISLLIVFAAQLLLHKVKTDMEAHSAIALVVHSYILQLSGLALLQQSNLLVFLILFYIGFNLVMKFRPEKSQI